MKVVPVKYTWKDGRSFPVNADIVGAELERIGKRDGGVNAEVVVNEARPLDAPLHPCFDWDDTTAASRWRVHQARRVLNSIREITIKKGEPIERRSPAWISIGPVEMDEGEGESQYRPIRQVTKHDDIYAKVVEREWKHLRGMIDRYEWVAEFQPLREAAEIVDRIMTQPTPMAAD